MRIPTIKRQPDPCPFCEMGASERSTL